MTRDPAEAPLERVRSGPPAWLVIVVAAIIAAACAAAGVLLS